MASAPATTDVPWSPVRGDAPTPDLAALDLAAWFEARVRPLVQAAPGYREGGTWEPSGRLPTEAELVARVAEDRAAGTPERATLTAVLANGGGQVATVVAAGVVRDAILLRAARPGGLELLRTPGHWYADARLGGAAVAVVAGHPWAGRPDVEVLPDRPALEAAAVAEVEAACRPLLELVAVRSRRGRAGLWAQVGDAVGWAADALCHAAPAVDPEAAMAATRRLLDLDGAPWRHPPRQWVSEGEAGAPRVLVTHRGSCCLYYQCEPVGAEAAEPPDADHRAYLERFGDAPPRYCGTCLHRDPADVEARVRFFRERELAAAAAAATR